ncbi:MAG: acyl--CoA ligase [Actinomycetota bacterium]|nr:acyl--CoA ligase [Actinomycetota bacterium]
MKAALLAPSLEDACQRWSDRPALTHRGTTLTYEELWTKVVGLAGAYRWLGVRPGDRVVCQLPTSAEHLVAMNAAWAAGAVYVGADSDLTGPELSWLVGRTEAAAVVFQPRADATDPLGPVRAVRDEHPSVEVIADAPETRDLGCHSLTELLASRHHPAPDGASQLFGSHDPALVLMTSGTTGKPKGVMETLPSMWAKFRFFADALAPGPDDVHLVYLPIAHAFGLKLSMTALLSGGRLVMLDRFTPAEALRLVTEERATVVSGTPTHFKLLVGALDPSRHRTNSLRWAVAAAAALSPPLLEEVYGRMGVELLFVYGCTEGFLTQTTDRDQIFRGSVGKEVFCGPEGTAPNGSVAVVNPEDGRRLPPGEIGEIVFGARQPVRYWKDPDAATDGWYRTGDLGRLDADGCVYVVGRLKDLVNRGGLKVAPGEVEAELVRHPDVADGAILGTPDPVLGEAVCACVVPAGAEPPPLVELRSFLGRSLARHKLPDELCVLDTIPRSKISKVDRAALRTKVVDADLPRERLRVR